MEFSLRPWAKTDLQSLVQVANDWDIARYMTDGFPHPYTEAHGLRFLAFAMEASPRIMRAIVVNGAAVGGIGIHPQDDIMRYNAELGYWLAKAYWGRGIATRAVCDLVAVAFRQTALLRIYARPFGSNLPSQRVLEKAGFKLEARLVNTIFKKDRFEDE